MNSSDYIIRNVYLEDALYIYLYIFMYIYMYEDLLYARKFMIQSEINNTHCSQ